MRALLLVAGVAVLAATWLGPLPALARPTFAAHMAMHMAVVALAAPLLALAVAGASRDPVRAAPLLFAPIPASMLEGAVVWTWHAPALHHFARHGTAGIFVEQGSFLAAGLLLWLGALGGRSLAGSSRTAAGCLALLLTFMHMTLLGVLLALAPRAIFAHGESALADQHAGGVIMLIGGFAYLAGGVRLAAVLVRKRATPGADRAG